MFHVRDGCYYSGLWLIRWGQDSLHEMQVGLYHDPQGPPYWQASLLSRTPLAEGTVDLDGHPIAEQRILKDLIFPVPDERIAMSIVEHLCSRIIRSFGAPVFEHVEVHGDRYRLEEVLKTQAITWFQPLSVDGAVPVIEKETVPTEDTKAMPSFMDVFGAGEWG